MNKVTVCGNASGSIITPSKTNPDYGTIRVEQVRMTIDEGGFARAKKLSALIPGTITDLRAFGWVPNQEVEGKVIFKEQLKAFNKKEPERDYKEAGKTGVICTFQGSPIYRKTFYNPSSQAEDSLLKDEEGNLITHDNKEEIKAAYEALRQNANVETETALNEE